MPRVRIQYDRSGAMPARIWFRWLSLGIATFCFTYGAWTSLEQRVHQAEAEELFDEAIQEQKKQTIRPKASITTTRREKTEIAVTPAAPKIMKGPIARLDIPRLSVSGYVEDGFDAKTLQNAIGRSPYSARPGERGNIVLAAHRDTFFAGLRDVRVGDVVNLQSINGRKYRYKVTKVFVVNPTDSWVMRSTADRNLLTLITCYPFRYVGNAPNRLVVQAQPLTARSSPERL